MFLTSIVDVFNMYCSFMNPLAVSVWPVLNRYGNYYLRYIKCEHGDVCCCAITLKKCRLWNCRQSQLVGARLHETDDGGLSICCTTTEHSSAQFVQFKLKKDFRHNQLVSNEFKQNVSGPH